MRSPRSFSVICLMFAAFLGFSPTHAQQRAVEARFAELEARAPKNFPTLFVVRSSSRTPPGAAIWWQPVANGTPPPNAPCDARSRCRPNVPL
jgi:hypothetical protein